MHTIFAHCSTWKIVCKISSLRLLSATAGCAVVVVKGPGVVTSVCITDSHSGLLAAEDEVGVMLGHGGGGLWKW